ncbi:hypothetical protein HQ586_02005 [Candidatus Bathyarchaeota archaeon]|nr:hypothetical protein [Candidatus Bathyarchaeota archaeon]
MSEFDVLIENAQIVDGSGKAPYRGSIGVKGGMVAALGDVKGDAVEPRRALSTSLSTERLSSRRGGTRGLRRGRS